MRVFNTIYRFFTFMGVPNIGRILLNVELTGLPRDNEGAVVCSQSERACSDELSSIRMDCQRTSSKGIANTSICEGALQ